MIITASSKKTVKSTRPTYKKGDEVKKAEKDLSAWEKNKPQEYESKYTKEIDTLLDSVLTRPQFNYNLNSDPLYNQYRELYVGNAKKAMADTVGKVSSLTGGYGNSYAVTAGQQAYDEQLNELNSVGLKLRDRAYEVYKDEGDELIENISVLRDLDGDEYEKYLGELERYYQDGEYLLEKLSTMSDSEYEKFLVSVEAWENDRDFEFKQYQDKLNRQEFEKELAFKKAEAKRDQANKDRSYQLAASKASSNEEKKESKTRVPTSYGEFCLRTGFSGIMTNTEFNRSSQMKKEYKDYQEYLEKMYKKYS